MCRPPTQARGRVVCWTLLLIAVVFASVACVTERSGEPDPPRADNSAARQRMVEPPRHVNDIAGYLLKYRTAEGDFPPDLASLREAGLMPEQGFAPLDEYAYHPGGLGKLEDGRRVLFVDRRPTLGDHIWCILQDPLNTENSAAISVTLVRLYDLEQAAGLTPR